jgi:hypothetical protein
MSDEKKIVFSADDKVSGKAKQIFTGILNDAQKYTTSIKEQNSFIQQQIKLLEKKAQAEKQAGEGILKRTQQTLSRTAPGLEQQQELSKYRAYQTQYKTESKNNEQILGVLKQLLNESKKENNTTERTEKEQEREDERKAKYELQRRWRVEAKSDKEAVRDRISKAEEEGYGTMDSVDIEKLHYQKNILGKEKPDESTFRTIVGAMMTTAAISTVMGGVKQFIASPTGTQGLANITSGVGQGVMGMGIKSGNAYVAAAGGVIDLLSSLLGGSVEARHALQPGYNRMGAKSGGNIGIGGNVELGYTSLQAQQLQEGLLNAGGSAANVETNTGQAQTLQRGLGLDQSVLIQAVMAARTIGSSTDLVSIVSKVLKYNPDLVKDQTKTQEILQGQLILTNQLAQQTEKVNQGQVAGVFGALRSVGGSFLNNPELMARNAASINQSLANPTTDYQRARSFGVLSKMSPGSSYLQLLEAQEKGISQQGYLGSYAKQLLKETGGGDNFALSLKQNLGLSSYSTAELFAKDFQAHPEKYTSFKGSEADIAKMVGVDRAKQYTPEQEQIKARTDEQALTGAMGNLAGQFNKLTSVVQANTVSTNNLEKAISSKYENGIATQ